MLASRTATSSETSDDVRRKKERKKKFCCLATYSRSNLLHTSSLLSNENRCQRHSRDHRAPSSTSRNDVACSISANCAPNDTNDMCDNCLGRFCRVFEIVFFRLFVNLNCFLCQTSSSSSSSSFAVTATVINRTPSACQRGRCKCRRPRKHNTKCSHRANKPCRSLPTPPHLVRCHVITNAPPSKRNNRRAALPRHHPPRKRTLTTHHLKI